MLIIGLGHKARQGKNSAALELYNQFPLDACIFMVAFADALRKEVNTAIRQTGSAYNLVSGFKEAGLMPDWVRAEPPMEKQRTLLQWWGTNYRRAKDPDYWVKRFGENLCKLQPDVAIVTDLRFPNEADYIRSLGGVLVKVTRTTPPDVTVPEHESERAMDGYAHWDYHLKAATLPELKAQARELYAEIASKHGYAVSLP